MPVLCQRFYTTLFCKELISLYPQLFANKQFSVAYKTRLFTRTYNINIRNVNKCNKLEFIVGKTSKLYLLSDMISFTSCTDKGKFTFDTPKSKYIIYIETKLLPAEKKNVAIFAQSIKR